MKKLTGVFLLIASLIALFLYRDNILSALSWFANLEAITASMKHAGIWGPVVSLRR